MLSVRFIFPISTAFVIYEKHLEGNDGSVPQRMSVFTTATAMMTLNEANRPKKRVFSYLDPFYVDFFILVFISKERM